MPSLTLGRAAKLFGLYRSFLYAEVSRGSLSVRLNSKGQKVVDLGEMIRVFGKPPSVVSGQTNASTVNSMSPSPVLSEKAWAPLWDELRLMREEQQMIKRENRLLREEVRVLREALLSILEC